MNKQIFLVAVIVMIVASFTACTVKKKVSKGRKALVVYFSRSGENYIVGKVKKGNTAFIAEYIAEMTGADLYEIKSVKPYETYSYEKMLNTIREEKERGEKPRYTTQLKSVKDYDVIFVGGPIWWGTFPAVMFSFFDDYDMNGKTIVPFTTNEGSGLGMTVTDLQRQYPKAKVLTGFSIFGQEARKPEAKKLVADWLSTFSYDAADEVSLNDNRGDMADGVTGASPLRKPLTLEGKKAEHQVKKEVVVKQSNGKSHRIWLTIQGGVDMGDGLLWNATNLGAKSPMDAGNHYAWGETESKKRFAEDNYKYHGKPMPKDIKGSWYDAATKELGGDWRMPTCEEWHQLLRHTQNWFVEIEGTKGRLFKSQGGNYLFLPSNGYIYDTNLGTPNEGYYWSSSNSDVRNAYVTYLPENSFGQSNYGKATGIGIRAVRKY